MITYQYFTYILLGALEFLIKKRSKKHVDISRLFVYYNSRLQQGLTKFNMEDRGTYINKAISALKKYGSCKEISYPYNLSHINNEPSKSCYLEAANYLITDAGNINVHLSEMKSCLAEGYSFLFGLNVFKSFADVNKDGRISMSSHDELMKGSNEWHAMLAVGYSDQMQCFFVRNSYGRSWVSLTLIL